MSMQAKPHLRPSSAQVATADSFQNFLTRTGIGTGNLTDAATYGYNPITKNRIKLEFIYRGSWIAGAVIDAIAEDMTREGVDITSDAKPDQLIELQQEVQRLQVWPALTEMIKWARLYGGAIGYLMIEGQDAATPLRVETVKKGQFKGILPLDRWQLQPTLMDLVTELGPELGRPKYYDVLGDTITGVPRMRIHHSRCVRMEGVRLPINQRVNEDLWGQSEIERMFDRLVGFDSTTAGVAQLVYKAHLRTYKVKQLREIIATGGPAFDALTKQINMIRLYQQNEGMTLMDAEDEFEAHQYTFAGLDSVLLQFGQQLSGASGIPLVRLFGQSPAGLNSTGESDLRMHYDNVRQKQENSLRPGVEKVYGVSYRSTFGTELPKQFSISFKPLWQMSDQQKAEVTERHTNAIATAYDLQITRRATALRDLKQLADITGAFSNITDEEIAEAEHDPPPTPEALGLDLPAPNVGPQAQPGAPGADKNRAGGANLRTVA